MIQENQYNGRVTLDDLDVSIHDFIVDHIATHGESPDRVKIADRLGVSVDIVNGSLSKMVELKLIRIHEGWRFEIVHDIPEKYRGKAE